MPSSQTSTASRWSSRSSGQMLFFIDDTPTDDIPKHVKRIAQKRTIRAQAARASSNARLETIRKRAEEDGQAPQAGQSGKPGKPGKSLVSLGRVSIEPQEPIACTAVQQHKNTVTRHRNRDASAALHAHTILGGSIPLPQADVAILAHFLDRFKSARTSERPWVNLVLAEAVTSDTPSLVAKALQANASALCANDLREPEVHKHATKLYLSTISQLQSSLRSSSWRDSTVMYTCMILTLYEIIQTSNPSAQRAHVSGVAHLVQQRGPESFVYGLEHKTFRYYRINILMMFLADRQPCFLAETPWKTIPFSGDSPPKTIHELLIDILVEIPGVLALAESLRSPLLGRYTLIQKACELAYWVRCLMYSLEKWKEDCIWTYPTMCTAMNIRSLDLLALCEFGAGLLPYDAMLGEALNSWLAAHLILARISQRLTEKSLIIRAALRPPYILRDLVAAIVLVSNRHISTGVADMISMAVTAFPLKVARNTTELQDPTLLESVQALLCRLNDHFANRYNINYSVSSNKTGDYEV